MHVSAQNPTRMRFGSAVFAMVPKVLLKRFKPKKLKEGAGFIVRRPVGDGQISDKESDPFLLLDELGPVTYKKGEFPGAPWHPHRGFDTVAYIKEGEGEHSDSMGNNGILRAGDCQWMTAASGIIHDEGKNHPGGLLHGFQCWVNLPTKHKMDPPAYQDVPSRVIPVVVPSPGVTIKIIAGRCAGKNAVVQTLVPIQYVDVMLAANKEFTHDEIDSRMTTTIVYIYRGSGMVDDQAVSDGDCLLLGDGDSVTFKASDSDSGSEDSGMDVLFLAGEKINEPIARHGPFVMNTIEEIEQCFEDYRNGTLVKHKATMRKFDEL